MSFFAEAGTMRAPLNYAPKHHDFKLHLYFDRLIWEVVLDAPKVPGFLDNNNGIGETPQEALEQLALD